MTSAYRGLSHLIALLIIIQTALIAFAAFGLLKFIDDGGLVTKMNIDDVSYTGSAGWAIHGGIGEVLIPIAAIAMFIVALVSKLPGTVKWSGIVLGLVIGQVLLGVLSTSAPILGLLHGVLALLLLGVVILAGHLVKHVAPAAA